MTSWSVSLLNETNRRLREEVEAAQASLQSRQTAYAAEQDALRTLRYQLKETQQHLRELNTAVTNEQTGLTTREEAVKTLRQEIDGLRRICTQLTQQTQRLSSVVEESATLLSVRRAALAAANAETSELESEINKLVRAHAEREQSSEALQSATLKEGAWQALWQRLHRLTQVVKDYESAVVRERGAMEQLVRETNIIQSQRTAALRDQRESQLACEQVEQHVRYIMERTRVNAETMAALQSEATGLSSVRQKLVQEAAELTAQRETLSKQREMKMKELQRKQSALRDVVLLLKTVAQESACEERNKRLAHVHNQALREQLAEQVRLCEELRATLAEYRDRYAELDAIRHKLTQEEGMMSNEIVMKRQVAAEEMLRTLRTHVVRLDARVQRLRSQYDDQLHTFRMEGSRTEELSRRVQQGQHALSELAQEQRVQQEKKQTMQATLDTLRQDIDRVTALVREAMTVQETQRYSHSVAEAYALRETLQRMTQQCQQWLRENTALRSTLRQSETNRMTQGEIYAALHKACSELASEVAQLEEELQRDAQIHQSRTAQLSEATIALNALQQAKQVDVQQRRDIAGWPERLRGAAAAAERDIAVTLHGVKLRLHLEQQAHREQSETLRRLRRQCELLRSRYAETMQTLARHAHHPSHSLELNGNQSSSTGNSSNALSHSGESEVTPEMLHAQILLRRSCEREQLQARGNYLDLRLVSLERETQGLQRMLHSLRNDKSGSVVTSEAREDHNTASAKRIGEQNKESSSTQQQQVLPAVRLMRDELALQEATLRVVAQHKDELRGQQQRYRKALQALQQVKRQKALQLERMQETVRRAQRVCPAQSVRLSSHARTSTHVRS